MKCKLNSTSTGDVEVPIHKVLTDREIKRVIQINYQAKEQAMKTGAKTPVIDWAITNLLLWAFRISEAAQLECGQIHPEYIRLIRTKGGTPRNIIISPDLFRILQEHLHWKASIGEPVDEHAPFFYSRRTKRHITRQGLAKAFNRAMSRAQIDKRITTHGGRRTFASHNEITFAQAMLGHKNRSTTEIYTYVLDAQSKAKRYAKKLYSGLKEPQ